MKKTKQETTPAAPAQPVQPAEHPFRSVLRAGVPLVAYETADPAATINQCMRQMNGKIRPCIQWDTCTGLKVIRTGNETIDKEASAILKEIGEGPATYEFSNAFPMVAAGMERLNPSSSEKPVRAVFFAHMSNRAMIPGNDMNPVACQAVWNCRDLFKATGSTLVLLGPSVKLPPELSNDAPTFEEPTPTQADIERLTDSIMDDAKGTKPEGDTRARVIDSLTGYLSEFAIEQSLALAMCDDGNGSKTYNLRRLWELKVASLKNTAGLEITQPEITFADMAGNDGAKDLFGKLINGRERFKGVFWLDEIEKMLAGGGGDLSGTSQAMIEQFLYWTEARKVLGVLLIGVPGAGKSHTAQCVAGQARVPLLRGSMSTVKGSLVGQSEQNMKAMLKAVDSVTTGKTLLIATCNSFESLTPEIMARFKIASMFYDYPTTDEAKALWTLYRAKYEVNPAEPVPPSHNWVGREIESCCHRAWLFNCTLAEAAQSVVPVCRANGAKMEALRKSVSGRFLSAARPGIYELDEAQQKAAPPTGRRFE